MNLKITIAFFILTCQLAAYTLLAQTAPGFVQQDVIRQPGVYNDSQVYPLTATGKQTSRVYMDGLGRAIQSVALQASPAQQDMIAPVAYDNLGRQTTSYLPYAGKSSDVTGSYRPNAITADQPAFYNQTGQYLIPVDADPYSSRVFENSPLQRMLQAGNVGNGYQPGQHYKTINYRTNTNALDGNILIWNMDGTLTASNYYADLSLAVTDGTDEDGVETQAFADLAGHTILKRQILTGGNLDTYYIYNTAGMLIYVVPPAAVVLLLAHSTYTLTTAPLNNMVFFFVYDNQGRLTQKTVPAKGTVSTVYDPLNRPVLVQDANMNANNQWNYIKYDVKGRAISQGIYTDPGHSGLTAMQSYLNTMTSTYNTAWYEARSTASATGYYTDNIFPTGAVSGTSITPLAYAYFDDYNLNHDGSTVFSYVPQSLPNESMPTGAQVKGMPTMVSKTTVGAGITANTWLTSVTFYDKRLNPIQTQSNNHLNYTVNVMTDYATTAPDFTGVPQAAQVSKTTASGAGGTTTVRTIFTYDNMYRVLAVDQYYNGSTTVSHVAAYQYSEAGQLVTKTLGYTPASTWLQTVNMRYSIRGQLLYINNSKLADDGGVTSNEHNDLFGMQLLYETTDSNLGNRSYYDGRISGVKWMTGDGAGTNTNERAFKYTYDGVNRYNGETYTERAGSSTGTFNINTDGFDESAITYDANGNLLTLKRNSSTIGNTGSPTQIDNLVYGYSNTNPNQLNRVRDGQTSQYTTAGFRDLTGVDTTHHYLYDANGNLTADPYKGLTLAYDVLNHTDKITVTTGSGQYIDYTYNADGTLLRKRQYTSGTLTTTTDYIDGFLYINGTLSYTSMPEGRLLNVSGTLTQEFIITDQQGNARISFQNNGSNVAVVKQETSYYGFGLQLLNSPVGLPAVPNKKLYNGGSEWQNDYSNGLPDYYETFNRNYDAALGRFVGVDPVAESAESMSSYQYAGNNPVMNNDPVGNNAAPNYQQSALPWVQSNQDDQSKQFNPAFNPGALAGGGSNPFPQPTLANTPLPAGVSTTELLNAMLAGTGFTLGPNGLMYNQAYDKGYTIIGGVKIFLAQANIGAALGFGVYGITQSGVASDKFGISHFVLNGEIHLFNQGESLVVGADAGLSFGFTYDWNSDSFLGYLKEISSISAPGVSKGDFGIGLSGGQDNFGISFGLQAGVSAGSIQMNVQESVSVTDPESEQINSLGYGLVHFWVVRGVSQNFSSDGTFLGYQGTVFVNGEGNNNYINTGVKVYSNYNYNNQGASISNNIWSSNAYHQAVYGNGN